MNDPTHHRNWSLGMPRRVSGAALVLAVMFVPAVLPTGLAQAQAYSESVLHTFTGPPDGEIPFAGLVRDAQGNLYGTTDSGGDSACDPPYGCGTVFKLDTSGKETVLYSFTGTGGDGGVPFAALVQDAQGNLYGTTSEYGASGRGTVFKVDPTGKETVLYSFTGAPDGEYPAAGVVQDAQGNLYGTTAFGGDASCGTTGLGCGTAFKLDTTGKETVLHTFTGTGGDGAFPDAGLVQDAQGNLYGTTYWGGGSAACEGYGVYGCGTVFKLDTTGKETVLYTFTGTGGTDCPTQI